MIKGVIFDMDGVLVDNREAHIEAFVIFCRRYGIDMSHDALMPFYGMGNDEIIPEFIPREIIDRVGLNALADEKEAIYRDIYASTIEPVAGLAELLDELREEGVTLAVGSSGMKANVDYVLEKCGITEYFDVVVNGDMVTRRKPDPEIFLLCARLMGLTPAQCLVFEDSLAGLKAARSAGMKVVALATTLPVEELKAKANTDLIVNDFTGITPGQVTDM